MGLVARHLDGTVTIDWHLDVDAEVAWRHLIDLGSWPNWLGSPIRGRLDPGGELIVDHGQGYRCTSEIEHVDERSLAMTWSFPDEHRTRLEISVSDTDDGGSLLVLRHHDLRALGPSYSVGWLVHLTYLEASVMDAPIPMSQFWPIHRTFEALVREGSIGEGSTSD